MVPSSPYPSEGIDGSPDEVRYKDMPPEVYRSLGFPGADDLGNMFQFKRDFEKMFCGDRDVGVARSLNPSLQTFEDWLAVNKNRIPIEKEPRRATGE